MIRYKMLYKSKMQDSTIFYRAFVGHTKKLFWFSYPNPSCHYSISVSSSKNRIVSPAVTPRSQVTVPLKQKQQNSSYGVDPVIKLNHDTDYQEHDEEAFLDDDAAPYLIEGDIALPEVRWWTDLRYARVVLKLFWFRTSIPGPGSPLTSCGTPPRSGPATPCPTEWAKITVRWNYIWAYSWNLDLINP